MNYLFHIILAIGFIKSCSTQSSTMSSNLSTDMSAITTQSSSISTNMSVQTTQSLNVSTNMLTQTTQSSLVTSASSSIPAQTTQTSSTTTVASTSTLSINEITSPFWVRTGCNITILTDITTAQFKSDMELKLSNAYATAYNLIQTSGRRRRAITNGTNTLQLIGATRITSGQVPTNLVYYIVTSDKSFVAPSTIISNMNQLSLQQMSIYLGVPVTTVATYYNSATQNPIIDEKLWIIGAVFGSLAAVALIIWLILFVYSRCIKPWDEPLILKLSSDFEENRCFTEYSKSSNMNAGTTIMPMVGTTEDKSNSNSKAKYKTDEIRKDKEKETKKDVKHERIKNYTEFQETENLKIEDRSIKEIVIKHVYEEKRKKHRKKHSSTSSSDSDSSSSNKKSKKKTKLKEVKIKSDSEKEKVKPKKSKDNDNKKSKKKKISNEIPEKAEVNKDGLEINPTMMFTKNDDISKNLDDEKMADILQMNKADLPKIEDDYSVPAKKRLQSPQSPEKLPVNVIEVQPKSNPPADLSKYELVEPIELVDKNDHLIMFPSYSKEVFMVPDTSLNFVKSKTADILEKNKAEMKESKLKKSNLRTLDPISREIFKKN